MSYLGYATAAITTASTSISISSHLTPPGGGTAVAAPPGTILILGMQGGNNTATLTPPGTGVAPAVVQSAFNEGSNPPTTQVRGISKIFPSLTTAGNTLVSFYTLSDFAGIHADAGFSDSSGNTWTTLQQKNAIQTGGAQSLLIGNALSIIGDSTIATTVTTQVGSTDTEDYQANAIFELSNVTNLIGSNGAAQNGVATGGTNNLLSGTVTVTSSQVPCLMLAACMNTSGHGVAPTVGTGMTSIGTAWSYQGTVPVSTRFATQLITTAGTYQAVFTGASAFTEDYVTVMAIYQGATTGWTALPGCTQQVTGNVGVQMAWWRVADGTEPATLTLHSTVSDFQTAYLLGFSGRNTTNPFTASTPTAQTFGASPFVLNCNAVSASINDDVVILGGNRFYNGTNAVSYTPPTGFANAQVVYGAVQYSPVAFFSIEQNVAAGSYGSAGGTITVPVDTNNQGASAFVISLAANVVPATIVAFAGTGEFYFQGAVETVDISDGAGMGMITVTGENASATIGFPVGASTLVGSPDFVVNIPQRSFTVVHP